MKKELTDQSKKEDSATDQKMKKLIKIVVECSFLAFTFSIVALMLQGFSVIFIATLTLSIITLFFALKERRKLNANAKKSNK